MGSTGMLHYLGLFMAYTMLAIGAIYAVYWYLRRHAGGGGMLFGARRLESEKKLEVESMMPLEARKNLYVIRSGNERFLIATSLESTQFLSRLEPLESAPAPAATRAGEEAPPPSGQPLQPILETAPQPARLTPVEGGFGARMLASLRWLAASRFKLS